MSLSDSSFDGIRVDFDDDTDIAQSGTSFEIPDQGGGDKVPDSVTSACASMINTGSTSLLDCGPQSSIALNTYPSKWVLGVRQLSCASNALNERMAKRGKHFTSNVFNSNDLKSNVFNKDFKQNFSYAQKRDIRFGLNYPMDDIEEVSSESYDTFHSHHVSTNTNPQKNGFNKIKDKRHVIVSTDRLNSGLKSSKEMSEKFVCPPSHPKPTDGLHSDKTSKSISIASGSKSAQIGTKIGPTLESNGIIPKENCGKRTKNCDKNINNCDTNKSTPNTAPIKKESSEPTKMTHKLSTNYKRSVNSLTLSAEQELQRYKSQRYCETVSLITIIFGIILVTITPFLLIPIWVIPNQYSPLIRNFLWLSLLTSVVLLSVAALTGNIYWYFDEKNQKWKWFYHCGKGPNDHYWGATLLHNQVPFKPLAKKAIRTNLSINV